MAGEMPLGYCWTCKSRGPILGWGIGFNLLPKGGGVRPFLRFRCPVGHECSRFLPSWAGDIEGRQEGVLRSWAEINWAAVTAGAYGGWLAHSRVLEVRVEGIRAMYEAGIKLDWIAELWGMSWASVAEAAGHYRDLDTVPKNLRRRRRRSGRRGRSGRLSPNERLAAEHAAKRGA